MRLRVSICFFLLFVGSGFFGMDGLSSFGYKGCCEGLCAQRLSESMGLVGGCDGYG